MPTTDELLRRQNELATQLFAWYQRASELWRTDPRRAAQTLPERLAEKQRLERELRRVELQRRVLRADLRGRIDRDALVRRLHELLEGEGAE